MTNNKINSCNRVRRACAYEPDSIRFHVNGTSASGVTPQCWTSTWHRARPGSNQYDEIGRRLGLSIDGSLLYSNSYDAFSRLTDTQIGTATSTYTYIYTNANPLVQSLTRPNGSVTTYQYDNLNRLATLSNQNSGSTVINQFSYVYSNDLRSSETVTNGSAITFSNDLITYDYNAVNQLLASTNTNSNQSFIYDADGNMTRGYTVDGYIFSASYNAENKLTELEYTDVSSVVHKTEYQYSGNSFVTVMKKYDAGTLTNETRFVRYGLLPLQERNSSNNVTREYTWGLSMGGGIGGLLNVKQSGQNYSYLYDGKGNVTAVIDSAEATAATYTYDAFGNLMVKTGSLDQPFQFSTKRYDTQTGLVYYGYRFYSPASGRWITRDPLGEAGGMNLYGFVGGNPVVFVDPYGLESVLKNPKVRTIASAGGAALAEYVASEMEPGKLRGGVYLVSAILSLDSAVSSAGVAIGSFTIATMTLPTGVSPPVAVTVGIVFTGITVYDISMAQEYLGKAIDDLTGNGNCPINN